MAEQPLDLIVREHAAANVATTVIHRLSKGKVRPFRISQSYSGNDCYYALYIESSRKSAAIVEQCRQWVAAALIGAGMSSDLVDNRHKIDLAA